MSNKTFVTNVTSRAYSFNARIRIISNFDLVYRLSVAVIMHANNVKS